MTDAERLFWTVMVVVGWLLLCRAACRGRTAPETTNAGAGLHPVSGDSVLVAWASQSGTAEQWARHSAAALQPFHPVRLLPLDAVDEEVLRTTRRALFVASTYGEGEAPDNGLSFQRRYLEGKTDFDLSHLEFAVLALGDRTYQEFCAFGRGLQLGLEKLGARPLWALTEADSGELQTPGALPEPWWQSLSRLSPPAHTATPGHIAKPWHSATTHWLLASRDQLNAGSPGAPLYRLRLTPLADLPDWRAGDIVEIQPRNSAVVCRRWLQRLDLDGDQPVVLDGVVRPLLAWLAERHLPPGDIEVWRARVEERPERWLSELPPLPWREYSAASVPAEGCLQLLVRLQCDEHGEPGIGSGWLGIHAVHGDVVTLRIRSNTSCHDLDPRRPMLLIGAGSGMAGLRAHLAERALTAQSGPNWLLFGERSRRSDCLLDEELQHWLELGHLSRLDRVFSRDSGRDHSGSRYVQDLLQPHSADIRLWVEGGATIHVCGSLAGMGRGVHEALETILGEAQLAKLREGGLYKRDLY